MSWLFPRTARGWRNALLRVAAGVVLGLAVPLLFLLWCTSMPGESWREPLAPLDGHGRVLRSRVEGHVRALAEQIGERHTRRPQALADAAAYIRRQLEEQRLTVREQRFQAGGVEVSNLEAELPGTSQPNEVVVVGAHYDTVPGTPGADDNATGVAALLELARLLRDRPHARTIRLVAFVNEEPPFFQDETMGSLVYARRCAEQGEDVVAMLALEMLGYFDGAAGTQQYPPPLERFYPEEGDFVAFVGNLASRSLVRRSVELFRASERFPSEGLAGPSWVHGVDFSDHWSFWQQGYPALMVTDTAFLRNRHYHEPSDTVGTVDYGLLARVTRGVAAVVAGLAERER